MIYDQITSQVSGLLISGGFFYSDQILLQGQLPPANLQAFCRLNWTLGSMIDLSTKLFEQTAILNLDLFQLIGDTNTIYDYAVSIRKYLMGSIFIFYGTNAKAKINSISISKNNNDTQFNIYNLSITFNIFQ